jgi:hypothetical protein
VSDPRYRNLYVIQQGDFDVVKIGIAVDVSRRASTLQSAHGHRPHVRKVWKLGFRESRLVETVVHRVLANCRLLGEWFEVGHDAAIAAIYDVIDRTEGGKTSKPYRHLFPSPKRKYTPVMAIYDGTASIDERIYRIRQRWLRLPQWSDKRLCHEVRLSRDVVVEHLGERPGKAAFTQDQCIEGYCSHWHLCRNNRCISRPTPTTTSA